MNAFIQFAIALTVGVLGYRVMPEGPWYRQLGAGALLAISTQLAQRWIKNETRR